MSPDTVSTSMVTGVDREVVERSMLTMMSTLPDMVSISSSSSIVNVPNTLEDMLFIVMTFEVASSDDWLDEETSSLSDVVSVSNSSSMV